MVKSITIGLLYFKVSGVSVQVSVFGPEGLPLALKLAGWERSQRDFKFRNDT